MTVDKKNRERRLPILFSVLSALALVLLATRWTFFRKPAPVAENAPVKKRMEYWRARIDNDLSDREAYLNLGILEEKAGFYLAAERHLAAARTLGVADDRICGPLGRALLRLSKIEEAKAELEKAVLLSPGKWDPVANLAGLYSSQGNAAKSNALIADFWRTAPRASLKPEELERIYLAFSEARDGKSSFAVAKYLVEQYPDYTNGLALAARAALLAGDAPAAKAYTEKALQVAPNDYVVLYFYGIVLRQLKDYDGALDAWRKANAFAPSGVDIVERIGEERARRGDFAQAAKAFETVAVADQELASAIRAAETFDRAKLPLEAAYWKAIAYGLRGQFSFSLEMSQKALESPSPVRKRRAQITMAEAYKGMGKKPEYLATILSATEGGDVDDLLQRARAYDFMDRPQKQEEYLRLALQKDPSREPGIRYDLGKLLAGSGKKDEGEREFERGIRLEPNNPLFKIKLAEQLLLRSGEDSRLARATQLLEEAIALDSQNENAWLLLGECYASKNQLPQAVQAIEHAIDLEAGNGPAYLQLGRVYARMGNASKSQENMRMYQRYIRFEQEKLTLQTRARRNGATEADIVAYGDLLFKAGYIEDALKQYKVAFALGSGNRDLKKKIEALSEESRK